MARDQGPFGMVLVTQDFTIFILSEVWFESGDRGAFLGL